MADGDQERFEDYLELERYIEKLQAGKAAHPPLELTPEQCQIYQMAALFRSASDEGTQPRPEFVEQLKRQLLDLGEHEEVAASEALEALKEVPGEPGRKVTASSVPEPEARRKGGATRSARFFSRRGLLSGGAIAAASLVIGAGVEHIRYTEHEHAPVQSAKSSTDSSYAASQNLEIAANIPTIWHLVTALADLGNEAVRFTSESIIGYVLRVAADADEYQRSGEETIIALSAACTHMGCLVQWQGVERHFYCPCHGAIFGAQGEPPQVNYKYSIPPLPRLNTKIENGNVYVELPKS